MNSKQMIKNGRQKGFTLIELMIATTVFSIVLTVILASFLQIGRMFYKGVSVNNTNEAARTLVDDISNDVKLAETTTAKQSVSAGKYYFCIGNHRYTYVLNQQVTASNISNTNPQTMNAGVIQDTIAGCQGLSTLGANPQQLLGPNMQLNAMDFSCALTGCAIHAHVIYYGADNTVFSSTAHPDDTTLDHNNAVNDPDARCSGNLLSTQFCAMADISTNVALKF